MICKCKVCDRSYEYNSDKGYDKEVCGPLCDGILSGRRKAALAKEDILRAIDNLVENGEHLNTHQILVRVVDEVQSAFLERCRIPMGRERTGK